MPSIPNISNVPAILRPMNAPAMNYQANPLASVPIHRLDHAVLHRLQRARAYPSVSVLLTTVPGAMLDSTDVIRLERLLGIARRRLASELPPSQLQPIDDRLRQLARSLRRQPTTRAIAIYASEHDAALVQLPVTVTDRVVVDPTFATRDLVRALALRPRVRILVISSRSARIIEGWPGSLTDMAVPDLSPNAPPATNNHDRARRFGREQSDHRQARSHAHLRHVADALSTRHATDPLPLIVAGVSRQLATWRAVTGNDSTMIGTISGNHEQTPLHHLDHLARPIIATHVRATRQAALDRLTNEARARCVGGIDDVWSAATTKQISLLCVEDGYAYPARTNRPGRRLEPAIDIEHPDVLDDAIDELIELVAIAGGNTVIVHDGALEGCARVAAVLHTH